MKIIDELTLYNNAINNFIDFQPKFRNKTKTKKVFFLRNEQVENFADKINYYAALSGLKFKISYSGYDNNLSFKKTNLDVGILWLDYSSYKINDNFIKWLSIKAKELSKSCSYVLIKPIISHNLKYSEIKSVNKKLLKILDTDKILIIDFLNEYKNLSSQYWDIQRSEVLGTKTSFFGQEFSAKYLGLKILPSLFCQKIKAIIFDLDDTLYTGTIGEDGIKKIFLDKNQKVASKIYTDLSKNGSILSICSKNNKSDANLVFNKKILNKKIFYPIETNWNLKSFNIMKIQEKLKVSFHNILFIDNNIAEILEVKKKISNINVFWAKDSLSLLNCLKYYPNIVDYFGAEDKTLSKKRLSDLKASLTRQKIFYNSENQNSLKDLRIKIHFKRNNSKEFDRIFSLTNKVNQFIFNYKRYDKKQLKRYLTEPRKFIYTVSLQDKLSDSGNVAVLYYRLEKKFLFLDEICISCRALGRNLEDHFIFEPVKELSKIHNIDFLNMSFKIGPSNTPAKIYFSKLQTKISKENNSKYTKKISIDISKLKEIYKKQNFIETRFLIN